MNTIMGIITMVCWIVIGGIDGCTWYSVKNKTTEVTEELYSRLFVTFLLAVFTIILSTIAAIVKG